MFATLAAGLASMAVRAARRLCVDPDDSFRRNGQQRGLPSALLQSGFERNLDRPRRASGHAHMKVFGFAGWSGSGKTVLIERILPLLTGRGLDVSLIKRAHHEFDVDVPGKDSDRHRRAGCREVLISSGVRWAHIHELRDEPEQSLQQLIARISPCDLLLVEGFKREAIPKLEVFRRANGKSPLHPHDPHIVAIAADCRFDTALPQFDLDDTPGIAEFVATFNRAG
jgi:molybdopterin-guanine dinucleotide biosynthesis protein B